MFELLGRFMLSGEQKTEAGKEWGRFHKAGTVIGPHVLKAMLTVDRLSQSPGKVTGFPEGTADRHPGGHPGG